MRGKLGNVVGFTNSASEKTNNNFYRERATTVSNPKTQKQATQRSKVKPAAAFYSAFESILNHAFLPSQRPVKNRNKFMKKAMQLAEVPDVRKDDNYLPILPYQVSEGNLGLDYLTVPTGNDPSASSAPILNFPFAATNDTETIAALSQRWIEQSAGALVEGEELTFMAIIADSTNDYVRRAGHISVVLDTKNVATTWGDLRDGAGFRFGSDGMEADSGFYLLGAALIISSKTSSSWRYTKSFFHLTPYAQNLPNITNEVILSYMSAEAQKTSDLILQQADNEASDGTVYPWQLDVVAVTNAEGSTGTIAPANASVVVYNSGNRKPVVEMVDGEYVLVNKSADGTWTRLTRTNHDVSALVPIDTTNLAASTYITLMELQRFYPELAY